MIERADTLVVPKPWGRHDLRPWYPLSGCQDPVGEVWFDRPSRDTPEPALRLKLLFTQAQLSIQVHPDDDGAKALGLQQGKEEAWYILSATPDATLALGLVLPSSADALRAAVMDGSIATQVRWRSVAQGDAYVVAPGTIHSLGAGLVLLEVQQSSDVTYRLHDSGRQRELQVDLGLAAASAGQEAHQAERFRFTPERTVLVVGHHFVFERVKLLPGTNWELNAMAETWAFTLSGSASFGSLATDAGDALYLEGEMAAVKVHSAGWQGLLAYAGSTPLPGLLGSVAHD